ncbi:hypothetical protein AAFF_G00377490 [Aldrovandia affinis]|uniref:A-kinase anchor protein 14 n=1 Tax=Aldrovandia affinis TaxID=143900 RepID=A0AAD7SG72_9TELE|nr:hypothetical protein AAFF_G00377490 [Aldrovandia affinis]
MKIPGITWLLKYAIYTHLNWVTKNMADYTSKGVNTIASEMLKTTLQNVPDIVFHQDQEEEKGPNKYEMKNVDWVTCKDFSIRIGKEQIEEYISTWELHPSWLFSLEFLQEKELEFCKEHHYRVQWSIPTRQNPIPKATACVYFVIEISKIKPQSLPVEVYYLVESCRLRHRPGKTRFREKWLKDIIESKTLLQDTVNF